MDILDLVFRHNIFLFGYKKEPSQFNKTLINVVVDANNRTA
jgi:hypothetical protein